MDKKRREKKKTKPSIGWWDQQFCGFLQHQRLSSHPNKKKKKKFKKKKKESHHNAPQNQQNQQNQHRKGTF